jgi:LmbE family N-acetylglucosaminyl deacetylase
MTGLAAGGRSVLAVFAHPDDESLACGGTLARLADEGMRVIVVSASHGERGGIHGPVRDDALGQIRGHEVRAAAAALGIAELIIGDHPDGDLQWSRVTELHAEIAALIRHHRPAAVITFGEDGLYWHVDHIGVHERTTTAVKFCGVDPPPLYYVTMKRGVMPEIVNSAKQRGWTTPPKGFWSLVPEAFGIAAEPPTVAIDVGPWVPRKLQGIMCHHSQLGTDHPFELLSTADARRLLGHEYFHRAAIPTTAPSLLEQLCD